MKRPSQYISRRGITWFVLTIVMLMGIPAQAFAYGGGIYLGPVLSPPANTIISMASGEYHALALKSDGTVWAWGSNSYGRLGDGTTTNRPTPVQVVGPGGNGYLTDVVAIAAGSDRSFALKSDGTVWAWGYNSISGYLGDGTTTSRSTPVQVKGPDGVGYLTDVVAIAAGDDHTLALKSDGTVWAWGRNANGQLGNGTTSSSKTPVQVHAPEGVAGYLSDIVAVSGGQYHSLALKSDGTVWAWGGNTSGMLGDGTTETKSVPVQVTGPEGAGNLTDVVAIAVNDSQSFAIRSDKTLWAWGNSYNGELSYSDTQITTPRQVRASWSDYLTDVVAITTGGNHSIAMKSDGTLWAFGENNDGQLGYGTRTFSWGTAYTSLPIQVKGPGNVGYFSDAVAVMAGDKLSLALKADGTLWAWGYNGAGVGDGISTKAYAPVQVQDLTDIKIQMQLPTGSLLVEPNTPNLMVGQTQQLTVTYMNGDGDSQDVTSLASYQIQDSTIASLESAGLVTALSPGSTNIIITYGSLSATVALTVTTLDSITATPNPVAMNTGESRQLTVTARFTDGRTEDVTAVASYASNNMQVAIVSENGLISTITSGNATITVNYNNQIVSVPVVVFEASSISENGDIVILRVPQLLNPVTYNSAAGFTVTENGINVPVTRVEVKNGTDGWPFSEVWLYLAHSITVGSDVVVNYSPDPNYPIIPVGGGTTSITQNTVAVNYSTVPLSLTRSTVSVAPGGDVVHVDLPTRVNNVDYTDSAGFVVRSGGAVVPVTRVVTEGTRVRLYTSYRIPANEPVTVTYTPVAGREITTVGGAPLVEATQPVTVLNESTAPLAFYHPVVSADGRTATMTSPANLSPATYEGSAGFRVFADGQEIPVVAVEVQGNKIILYLGVPIIDGQSLDVSYGPPDGNPISSENGNILPPENNVPGSNSSEVMVTGITAEPSAVNVPHGGTQQLTVTAHYSDGMSDEVTQRATYQSTDTGVATVSESGLVWGVAVGSASITVTYGGKTFSVSVTVVKVLQSISATPGEVDLVAGRSGQLVITAHYSDGSAQDVTTLATYQTSNPAVTTVSADGSIVGKSPGSANVTVSYQGKTATVPVTVIAPVVSSITVTPSSVSIAAGLTQQLTVMATMSDGSTQNVTDLTVYHSSDTGKATVSGAGLVTGVAQGSVNVTVTYQGKSVTVPVTITVPPAGVTEVIVQPEALALVEGNSQRLKVLQARPDGSTLDVTFFSSFSSTIPESAKVDLFGLVTGVTVGSANVMVTYQDKFIIVPVTVIPMSVTTPKRPETSPPLATPTSRTTGSTTTVQSPNRTTSQGSTVTSSQRPASGDITVIWSAR